MLIITSSWGWDHEDTDPFIPVSQDHLSAIEGTRLSNIVSMTFCNFTTIFNFPLQAQFTNVWLAMMKNLLKSSEIRDILSCLLRVITRSEMQYSQSVLLLQVDVTNSRMNVEDGGLGPSDITPASSWLPYSPVSQVVSQSTHARRKWYLAHWPKANIIQI